MEASEDIDNICPMQSEDNVGLSDIIDILNTLDSHNPELNGTQIPMEEQATNQPQAAPPIQSPQQPQNALNIQQKTKQKPFIKIVEQPGGKVQRFRYGSEGRFAGAIPGANSTAENKTYPTIEIVGYQGEVVVVVSCVTKDAPYKPHPHKLVGRDDGYKDGIYTVTLNQEPLRAVFSNLGIQCCKKKDIAESLKMRENLCVDPFNTKFAHKDQPSSIDLNVVRLCFQAFLKAPSGQRPKPLAPVVSDPIYDKKAMSDLVISRLCSCSARVGGGDEIIMLCERFAKSDIKVRFYETNNEDVLVWEDFAEFQQTDIHKQVAIAFKTPRYHNTDIVDKTQVFLQLVRPSDGITSESVPFEYYPDPGMRMFSRIRRKLQRKQDLEIFQQILSVDSETTATKYSCPPTDVEDDKDDDIENDNETISSESTASKPLSSDTLKEIQEAVKRAHESVTNAGDGSVKGERLRGMEIELEVPHINFPIADDSTQTSTPMEEILLHQQLEGPRQLSNVDKITEWMRSNEFERTDSLTVENGDTASLSPVTVYTNVTSISPNNHTTISSATDEDRTFTDLMEQVAELEDIFLEAQSRRGTLDNPILKELPMGDELPEVLDDFPCGASAQASVEVDETFDETATYTSLQRAFKNPVNIPVNEQKQIPPKGIALPTKLAQPSSLISEEDGLVVLTNPPAPKIRVNAVQTPPSPPTPPLIPPRTPSPVSEQWLPPIPPKRKTSQEAGSSELTPNNSSDRSCSDSVSSRPSSQIIIMRTPDQSPTKRQPTPTSSPKKRPGFFSRLFSRRKSKPETIVVVETNANLKSGDSKATTPTGSREPSIGHFSLADPNRSSIRSAKSMQQQQSPGLSPLNIPSSVKGGRPVGRSVSSASGKRPAHLNADVIHIPLKGESCNVLPRDGYSYASTVTFGRQFDRKTLSALQLADIPVCDGNMELVAIADRQSIRNLCEGAYGVVLDPSVDLGEAEHFALYTSVPPMATASECDDNSMYREQFDAGQILTAEEVARRLTEANTLQ